MINSYYLGKSSATALKLQEFYAKLTEDPHFFLSTQFAHCDKSQWDKVIPKSQTALVYFETDNLVDEEIKLLQSIKEHNPKLQWVLLVDSSLDYFTIAKTFQIGNILLKEKFDISMVRALSIRLMTGNLFGFDPYFLNGYTTDPIVKTVEGKTNLKDLLTYFEKNFLPHVIPVMHNRISTYFNELLVNTVSYSVEGVTPEERDNGKLQISGDTFTPSHKSFKISMAIDHEKYGLSITDSTGLLTLNRILEKLRRQTRIGDEQHPPGIWDLSGRGFALIQKDNRMIFNILKGVSTEIIFLHYLEPSMNKYESIIVTELTPSS